MNLGFGPEIWSIPLISAFVGYGTNYIAVKMIFRPRKQVSFLGIKIHGLVPRRHKEIAEKLGTLIERDLVSHHDVKRALQDPAIADEARTFVLEQVDNLTSKLTGMNPLVSMFLTTDLLAQTRAKLVDSVAESFPKFIDRVVLKVEDKLDFSEIIKDKIEAFDLGKLESIIYEISAKELRTIEVLGGVLGFTIGVIQAAFVVIAA